MLFAVFDVESLGLHGEGFAVGGVVVDDTGRQAGGELYAACRPRRARGGTDGREWLLKNLPDLAWTHEYPFDVRHAFWSWWELNKRIGARLAADVPWPVETRFLNACIDDADGSGPPRDWDGPYPLIDVASVRLAAGLDPLAIEPRLEGELPIHDPLADARQSARLLVEALQTTGLALDSFEAMHG